MDSILNFFDEYYFLIFIVMIMLPLWATTNVKNTIKKYSQIKVKSGLTGAQVAQIIIDKEGITGITIKQVEGQLTDNYNPTNQTVSLSKDIYSGDSISSVAVASHEIGHVIQHHENYFGLKLRSLVLPMASTGSKFAGMAIFIGLLSQATGLFYFGIFCLVAILLFQVATLPVEFNASKRALVKLNQYGLLETSEIDGSRVVLRSAALTYLTAVVVTLLNILRLIAISRRR